MKKVFSFKKPNKLSSKKDGKITSSNAKIIVNLVARTPEDLANSRCKAYSYLVP